MRQFGKVGRPLLDDSVWAAALIAALLDLRDDGELEAVVTHRPGPAVDPPFLVDRLEQIGLSADGFRRAQEQVATVVECEVEQADDLFLNLRLQVNQQVAATDHVQLGERRVGDQVLHREHDRIADHFVHLVTVVVGAGEEPG